MKRNIAKITSLVMAMVVSGSVIAMAEVGGTITREADPTASETLVEVAFEDVQNYISQAGTITEILEQEDGTLEVTMDNEMGGLRFLVSADTKIVDAETNALILASDLAEDMRVSVVYDKNSPMGMSLPAYLGQTMVVVANADSANLVVGHFDADLLQEEAMLALQIDETTNIQHFNGSRMILSAEDIQEQDALVIYGMSSRSIPAQTTPSFVMILPDVAGEPNVDANGSEAGSSEELVPLRETAVELGYTVTWDAATKSVVAKNDETSISVRTDEAVYHINGEEKTATIPATLVDGVLFVSAQVLQ